ncbi:hypothetical protein HAV15_004770 [Penicillium sp. str. |nr:hypothetical protein HAV15_004770 [Penicillium sp. str. \
MKPGPVFPHEVIPRVVGMASQPPASHVAKTKSVATMHYLYVLAVEIVGFPRDVTITPLPPDEGQGSPYLPIGRGSSL